MLTYQRRDLRFDVTFVKQRSRRRARPADLVYRANDERLRLVAIVM
jgi:hypothetical protein